jgi:hypothetical protein
MPVCQVLVKTGRICGEEVCAKLVEEPVNQEELGTYQSVCRKHYRIAMDAMRKALNLDKKR